MLVVSQWLIVCLVLFFCMKLVLWFFFISCVMWFSVLFQFSCFYLLEFGVWYLGQSRCDLLWMMLVRLVFFGYSVSWLIGWFGLFLMWKMFGLVFLVLLLRLYIRMLQVIEQQVQVLWVLVVWVSLYCLIFVSVMLGVKFISVRLELIRVVLVIFRNWWWFIDGMLFFWDGGEVWVFGLLLGMVWLQYRFLDVYVV